MNIRLNDVVLTEIIAYRSTDCDEAELILTGKTTDGATIVVESISGNIETDQTPKKTSVYKGTVEYKSHFLRLTMKSTNPDITEEYTKIFPYSAIDRRLNDLRTREAFDINMNYGVLGPTASDITALMNIANDTHKAAGTPTPEESTEPFYHILTKKKH